MRLLIALGLALGGMAAPAYGATFLPEVSPGWEIERIAEALRILFPTAIVAARPQEAIDGTFAFRKVHAGPSTSCLRVTETIR